MGIGTRRGRERKLSSRPGRRIPEAEMASMSSEAAPSDVDSTLPMMEVRFVLQHGNSHQSVENNARVSDDDAGHRPHHRADGRRRSHISCPNDHVDDKLCIFLKDFFSLLHNCIIASSRPTVRIHYKMWFQLDQCSLHDVIQLRSGVIVFGATYRSRRKTCFNSTGGPYFSDELCQCFSAYSEMFEGKLLKGGGGRLSFVVIS